MLIVSASLTPWFVKGSPLTPPPGPGCFWIESPQPTSYRISLVSVSESGYQTVEDSCLSLHFTRNFEYKIDHISKTKNQKNLKFHSAFVSEHAHLLGQFVFNIFLVSLLRSKYLKYSVNFEYKINYKSKNKSFKNRNIDFSFVSEHCATFCTKKTIIEEGGGGIMRYMPLTREGPIT